MGGRGTGAGPKLLPVRTPTVGAVAVRRLAVANLVVNVGIVVTGAAVRLTGSGLGCSEWPRCEPGAFVVQREAGIHGLLEFGNRTLSGVVAAAALATLVAVVLHRPRRRDLLAPAVAVLLGIVAQVVLGGVTVLVDLHPLAVGAHFLVSLAILAAAALLVDRSRRAVGPVVPGVPRSLLALGRLTVLTAAGVVVLGVLVTGTGPHSGDRVQAVRLDLDPVLVAQAHADAVFLFLGLVVGLVLALRAVASPPAARSRSLVLAGVVVAQGAVGYTQYFTGVPPLLVGVHVLGACVLWVTVVLTYRGLLVTSPSPDGPPASPSPGLALRAPSSVAA